MNPLPEIPLELTNKDNFLEVIGGVLLLTYWVYACLHYANLPEIIPIHYNALGEADGYGSKNSLFLLPAITSVLFLGITILNKYPHKFNYLVDITEENALRNYTLATRLLRVMKVIITIIFFLITFMTVRNAYGSSNGVGTWLLPTILAIIVIPSIYFLVQLSKDKR